MNGLQQQQQQQPNSGNRPTSSTSRPIIDLQCQETAPPPSPPVRMVVGGSSSVVAHGANHHHLHQNHPVLTARSTGHLRIPPPQFSASAISRSATNSPALLLERPSSSASLSNLPPPGVAAGTANSFDHHAAASAAAIVSNNALNNVPGFPGLYTNAQAAQQLATMMAANPFIVAAQRQQAVTDQLLYAQAAARFGLLRPGFGQLMRHDIPRLPPVLMGQQTPGAATSMPSTSHQYGGTTCHNVAPPATVKVQLNNSVGGSSNSMTSVVTCSGTAVISTATKVAGTNQYHLHNNQQPASVVSVPHPPVARVVPQKQVHIIKGGMTTTVLTTPPPPAANVVSHSGASVSTVQRATTVALASSRGGSGGGNKTESPSAASTVPQSSHRYPPPATPPTTLSRQNNPVPQPHPVPPRRPSPHHYHQQPPGGILSHVSTVAGLPTSFTSVQSSRLMVPPHQPYQPQDQSTNGGSRRMTPAGAGRSTPTSLLMHSPRILKRRPPSADQLNCSPTKAAAVCSSPVKFMLAPSPSALSQATICPASTSRESAFTSPIFDSSGHRVATSSPLPVADLNSSNNHCSPRKRPRKQVLNNNNSVSANVQAAVPINLISSPQQHQQWHRLPSNGPPPGPMGPGPPSTPGRPVEPQPAPLDTGQRRDDDSSSVSTLDGIEDCEAGPSAFSTTPPEGEPVDQPHFREPPLAHGHTQTADRGIPRFSIMTDYDISWKPRLGHFLTSSEVKVKEEKVISAGDLVNQKQARRRLGSTRITALADQIESISRCECENGDKLRQFSSVIPHASDNNSLHYIVPAGNGNGNEMRYAAEMLRTCVTRQNAICEAIDENAKCFVQILESNGELVAGCVDKYTNSTTKRRQVAFSRRK